MKSLAEDNYLYLNVSAAAIKQGISEKKHPSVFYAQWHVYPLFLEDYLTDMELYNFKKRKEGVADQELMFKIIEIVNERKDKHID